MLDPIERRVNDVYEDLAPSADLRDEVLGSLGEAAPAPRRTWVTTAFAAAAAAVLVVFLLARTKRDDRPPNDPPPVAAADVDAQRTKNEAAYASLKASLHEDHHGKWVVIAGGKLAATGKTLADVTTSPIEGAHRFVFQVGTEGDQTSFISTWYAARFAGPPLAGILDIDWTMGPNGVEVWREGGPRQKSFGARPFPRLRFAVGAPGDERREPLELFLGSVGPPLVLTRADYERLNLARFEVPGTHTMMDVPCTRVVVTAGITEQDTARPVIAAVSRAPDEQMIDFARWRHRFWDWGGGLGAQAIAPHSQGWIVFGNDRVLGAGATAEAAVRAAKGATDFAYHRYLVALPLATDPVPLEVAPAGKEPVRAVPMEGPLGSLGRPSALLARGDEVLPTVNEATAQRAGLQLLECPRPYTVSVRGMSYTARAAFAWRKDDLERTLVRVYILPKALTAAIRAGNAPGTREVLPKVTLMWDEMPAVDALTFLQTITGIPIVYVDGARAHIGSRPPVTLRVENAPMSKVLGALCDQCGINWRYKDRTLEIRIPSSGR